MNLPKFPQFNDLGLEYKPVLKKFFHQMRPEISDCNFTNLYMWQDFYGLQLAEYKGNICVFASSSTTPEKEFFFPPYGDSHISEAIQLFFDMLASRGREPIIRRASEQFVSRFRKELEGFSVEKDEDISDYIYRAQDLIHLKGRRYHGQRNFIARFKKMYSYKVEKITTENVQEYMAFCDAWLAEKLRLFVRRKMPEQAFIFLKAEVNATKRILANLDSLDVEGMIVRIDGKICGITIGELLNPEMAVIHVEKVDHAYLGLSQFINQEFCTRFWSNCKFINRMEDLGLESLRKAKMALGPHHMGYKYNIKPRQ